MPIYFAYGSNMKAEQMKNRCPSTRYIGRGVLRNHKIGFTRYSSKRESSVADIIPSSNQSVWGVIYEISENDLLQLDRHEGHPNIYKRIKRTILQITKLQYSNYDNLLLSKEYTEVDAEVYDVVLKQIEPTPNLDYLRLILDGAFEHDLPIAYQKVLLKFGENSYNKKLGAIIDRILYYEDIISKGLFPPEAHSHDEWGGANLVITGEQEVKNQLNKNYPHDLVVLTPHSRELSWLIHSIYWDDKIAWQVDYSNKHGILNEFGEASIEYQKQHPEDNSPIGICLSVLIRAYKIFTVDLYMMY
jgi:hypothetical protein